MAWLFGIYYLLHNGRASSGHVINFAKHFEKTKWRSILESAINLSASLILTYKFGIYGVILGTIIALFYRTNDMIIYASRILEKSPLMTYRRWCRNLIIFVLVVVIESRIQFNLDSYFKMMIYGIILSVTIIPLFIGVNSLCELESARYTFGILKNMLLARTNRKS